MIKAYQVADRRMRVVALLVLLSLLAFTTIRVSSINNGIGEKYSLSNTQPKQRQFCAAVFYLPVPVTVFVLAQDRQPAAVLPAAHGELPRECFFPRCSDLPPPLV